MTRRDLPPLDPQVASLLVSEKILVACDAEVKARGFARAAAAAASGPVAPPPPVHSVWRHSGARLSLSAAGFVLIAAAGSAAFQAWRHAGRPPEAYAPRRISQRIEASPNQALGNATAVGQTGSVSPGVPEPGSSAQPRHESSPMVAAPTDVKPAPTAPEPIAVGLGLLKRARVAVTRGDFSGALALLAKHEDRFPTGPLTEEREALRIRSLSGLGREGEAQRAAASFRVRFPHSVFLSHMTEISQHVSE
jgi:hypothetical protein